MRERTRFLIDTLVIFDFEQIKLASSFVNYQSEDRENTSPAKTFSSALSASFSKHMGIKNALLSLKF